MGDLEKRRHHRFMALLNVSVTSGDRVPADLKMSTIDISTGGARCACNLAVDKDATLRLTVDLIGGDLRAPLKIEAEARVLRCTERPGAMESRRYDISLQFTKMDAEDRKRLQSYLNSL